MQQEFFILNGGQDTELWNKVTLICNTFLGCTYTAKQDAKGKDLILTFWVYGPQDINRIVSVANKLGQLGIVPLPVN